MPPDLESSITFLEETNNVADAYFCYTVDPAGENGVIKANKEGLRLYAAELLKRSMELENRCSDELLFFPHNDWVVSDAGYELICGVWPQHRPRREILADNTAAARPAGEKRPGEDPVLKKGCSFSLLLVLSLGLILLAAYKAFPTLQVWVNIH